MRRLARQPEDDELRATLAGVDAKTAVVLARAFTAYFQLVNVTEQLHRWQEVTAVGRARSRRRWAASASALEEGSLDRDLLAAGAEAAGVPPGLHRPPHRGDPPLGHRPAAAHRRHRAGDRGPAPPARRAAAPPAPPRRARRPALADRRAAHRATRAHRRGPHRHLLPAHHRRERRARPARRARPHPRHRSASSCLPRRGRCASAPGPAATATATPTSRPRSPSRSSGCSTTAGLREIVTRVEELLSELSSSTRVVRVTDELRASLERDAEALPITYTAVKRLNAEEPYRLKLSFVRVRLLRTRDRLAHGTAHEPGRDYAGFDELLADLVLIRDSMLRRRRRADRRRLHPAADAHRDRDRARPRDPRHPRAQRQAPRGPRRPLRAASASSRRRTPTSTVPRASPCSRASWAPGAP